MNLNDLSEEKTRLDPACWHNKKIGNPKTKMKGGVRVNNCVPKEGVAEAAKGIPHKVRYSYDDPSGNGTASGHITLHAPDKESAARYATSDLTKRGKKNVRVHAVTPQKVAEGADVSSQIKRIKDRILQLKDWNTAGTHDKKIKELQAKLKELQSQKQGVAEGSVDHRALGQHHEEMTDQELRKVRSKLPDSWDAAVLRRKLASHPKYAQALKHYDKSEYHFNKAAKQGVAEGATEFVGDTEQDQELRNYAQDTADRAREQIKHKMFNMMPPEPKEDDTVHEEHMNPEYDDEAGMAQGSLHTLQNAVAGLQDVIDSGDNLPEWCQEKISLAEDYLVTVWDYIQSEKAQGIDPEIEEMYHAMESLAEEMAHRNRVSVDRVWEQFEALPDNVLYETAAWRRKEGKSKSGGLNAKGVASYRRENPGSKLQTAVTTKPSKLKPGSKAAKRRKSFCARMSGVKGPMKKPNGKPTRKALALRKWNC